MIQHGFQVLYTFVNNKHSIFYAIVDKHSIFYAIFVIIKMQLASI